MKIKVAKNMILHASSDILASLGESCFPTRNVIYFQHEHWSLWRWKSGVFQQLRGSKKLITLLLISWEVQNAVSREKGRK